MSDALRLLLVDDDPEILEVMGLLLGMAGHHVTTAQDGPAALARVAEAPFDAIVLDIQVPGMNGLELARRLRELPGGAAFTLVGLSGMVRPAEAVDPARSGLDGYLLKPVDEQRLLGTLHELLARRGASGQAPG